MYDYMCTESVTATTLYTDNKLRPLYMLQCGLIRFSCTIKILQVSYRVQYEIAQLCVMYDALLE